MGKRAIVHLCFVCLCFLEIVQLSPVPYRPLSQHELYRVALDCIDEVKIERSVIEKVLKTQVLPAENKKYKKYLACSYKKQGFLSPDGTTMLYDNLFQFLERFYDRSDLEALERCKLIKDDDPGELCFQNLDCVLEGLRKMELENDIVSNDIE